jgi:hypothetical protein
MNEVKIDKLFQDKLASYEVQPSLDAWEKVDARIEQKRGNNRYWLYAVAASLVLILTSVYIWTDPNNASETALAENNISETAIQAPVENAVPSTKEMVMLSSDESTISQKQEIKLSALTSEEVIIEELEYTNNDIKEYPNTHSTSLNVSLVKQEPELNLISAQFSLEFQFIPVENIDLTLPKDDHGIRKAYDYAMRVKNGEESLFNLRKAKNDLFAKAKNIKFNQSKPN